MAGSRVHATAIVEPGADLADDVTIGAYCYIESGARIGPGCRLLPRVHVHAGTVLGARNRVGIGAVLGGEPQDLSYRGERSELVVGDENWIGEYATMHRASGEGARTTVGNRGMFMGYSHVGHNCRVGDQCIITNYSGLAGHASMGDGSILSGQSMVVQYRRVGRLAFVAAHSRVDQDVPPFVRVVGAPARIVALNVVGLRRAGFSEKDRANLKQLLESWTEARELPGDLAGPAAEFAQFARVQTKHGVLRRRTTQDSAA